MASSAVTSWQTEGDKMEVVTDFLFLASKITADGDLVISMLLIFLFNIYLDFV